jgi:hypothetical protein
VRNLIGWYRQRIVKNEAGKVEEDTIKVCLQCWSVLEFKIVMAALKEEYYDTET